MMLKFVSSTSVVSVKILLAVGDSARHQGKYIEFWTNILLTLQKVIKTDNH